ncbi:MAG TPA: hypothetical protein VIL46_05260 [Gemmataceae bacterium]
MEQLTQPELHALEELLRAESLCMKKGLQYAEAMQDQDLKKLVNRCVEMHQAHFDDLLDQLHQLSGGLAARAGG